MPEPSLDCSGVVALVGERIAAGVAQLADHSAAPGAGATVGKSLHGIEESLLRSEVEAASLELGGRKGQFWPVSKPAICALS